MLRAEGLSKSFGSLTVTRDVSLELRRGERRALIGPNGAGKTTMFNLLTGELKPDRGKVFFGCANYPDCEFVMWKRPVDKACPECEKTYLVERMGKRSGRQLICDSENCEHVEAVKG